MNNTPIMQRANAIARGCTPDELIRLALGMGIHGDRNNPWPTAVAVAAMALDDERRG